jgi:hypothetical protein
VTPTDDPDDPIVELVIDRVTGRVLSGPTPITREDVDPEDEEDPDADL